MDRYYPGWRDLHPPEIWIWDMDQRHRSEDFIRRVPWVKFGGYYETTPTAGDPTFNKMYNTGGLDYLTNFNGFDWFLCFNGTLRQGLSLEGVMEESPINWNYRMSIPSNRDIEWAKDIASDGKYVLCYFSDHGMFKHWLAKWGPTHIAAFLAKVRDRSGCRLILTGSQWDENFSASIANIASRNLVGRTSFNQLVELIRCANGFVGWCGGNTILSPYLGTKTGILWCNYFKHPGFRDNWVDPEDKDTLYRSAGLEEYPSLLDAQVIGEYFGEWMEWR